MARINIDGKDYETPDGENCLHVALSLGLDLPYFCWHPAMGSVGACRQCAVKQYRDENDTRGRIVMACMTPTTNGARISIQDPEARAFRSSIIEGLMENHPHDCPVCDEGGECHLQDMTVMTGHNYRRYRGLKRTFRNQYLGPLVNHEMNRCIQCYRCVRFYRDFAGGTDLDAFRLRNTVFFGRAEDGVLDSEFSGNLVEVCPTGVFTDKTLKQHYTRKWDLQTAPSVCVNCSVGCNTIAGERYGSLRRILNRYNREVNGYFICDRGRYGYEFVNDERRVRIPYTRQERGAELTDARRDDAVRRVAEAVRGGAIGIGSPRASLESNFALRTLVGPERFYLGVPKREAHLLSEIIEILRRGPARSASLHDIETADAVLVLGEDVTNAAPMLDLAIRQAIRQQPMKAADAQRIARWDDFAVRELLQDTKGPLFIANTYATKLDPLAADTFHGAPADIARLAYAIGTGLTGGIMPADLGQEERDLAGRIGEALRGAERPVIVAGTTLGDPELVRAAANVAWALCASGKPAQLSYLLSECNSLGLALMGGAGDLDDALAAADGGAVVLENDLYRRAAKESVDRFMDGREIVVLDHLQSPTSERADVLLPAGTFAEADGTFVNNEGRAQRFFQVFVPAVEIQESWRWLRDVMAALDRPEGAWQNLDDVLNALSSAIPALAPVREVAPPSTFRIAGEKVARESARFSGRTAITANISVSEPRPPDDPDSALSFSMEGFTGMPPSALIPRFWAPGWNSVQALNKFQQEVAGPLIGGDPGRRLIEPTAGASPVYFTAEVQRFDRREGRWLAVPAMHIFGSEELSMQSPGVAELAPQPYVGLNPADASQLGVEEGGSLVVLLAGEARVLPYRPVPTLTQGIALVPASLPGLAVGGLPLEAQIWVGTDVNAPPGRVP